jgi:hypothetical protein
MTAEHALFWQFPAARVHIFVAAALQEVVQKTVIVLEIISDYIHVSGKDERHSARCFSPIQVAAVEAANTLLFASDPASPTVP